MHSKCIIQPPECYFSLIIEQPKKKRKLKQVETNNEEEIPEETKTDTGSSRFILFVGKSRRSGGGLTCNSPQTPLPSLKNTCVLGWRNRAGSGANKD